MKKFLFSFFVCILFYLPVSGQEYASRWLFTSEFSPSFPSPKDRIMENADRYSSLEWRNRIGVRTFGNMFVGVQGSIRRYSESTVLENSSSHFSERIESRLGNTMIGFGPFVNYYLELSPTFYLIASGFIGLEKGVGTLEFNMLDFNCPTCETEGTIPANYPQSLGFSSFKDVYLTYSGDFGMGYLINDAVGVQLMVNLLRYERSSFQTREYMGEPFNNPGFNMFFSDSKRGWTSISDRMIFHLGIFIALNLE
ncbi:hypothetical protein [Arthrospiribacter ruber]|uniref:Uncharacterized protein n=1 Tax=Arthrospiribacter ruber TaxID=2487934 RepID=A0A951MCJ7_9BACT|nr:hypothetical protein [Arthrospiribacter ruber]MBW3467994.1 hypothetical protein [Arthrospiribacter ruber]